MDKFIVSSYDFIEHPSLQEAEAERDRLMAKVTDKKFRVYRIGYPLLRKKDGAFGRLCDMIVRLLAFLNDRAASEAEYALATEAQALLDETAPKEKAHAPAAE